MSNLVKLDSVVKLLEDEAREANRKASECVGVDDAPDGYYQGLRNGYIQAVKLLKEKSGQPAF